MKGLARRVLDFWFGDTEQNTQALQRRMLVWFGGGDADVQRDLDHSIARDFGELIERASRGELQPIFASAITYAELHRDIVRGFGRFPHRNAILGRVSTPAEEAWLAAGAPDFGQRAAV